MARESGIKVVNKFSRGLITEATGLNFPEDAVVASDNVTFDPQSIARRRKGFAYETGYSWYVVFATASRVFKEFTWKNVNGRSTVNFVVTQVGSFLYFWRTTSSNSLSSGYEGEVNLTDHKAPSATNEEVRETPCQFATGNGFLFVTHPNCEPFFVEYTGGTFVTSEITIRIRDFEGLDDNLEVDGRPASLSDEHEYNLKNQGWHTDVTIDEDGGTVDPISYFKTKSGLNRYPSNADIWWLMKDSNEWFDPNDKSSVKAFGNTPAPRGHYILDAFYEDRSDVSDVSGISVVSAGGDRPSVVAFFAGRVWYAGAPGRRLSSTIYFSTITQDEDEFGNCYQLNDPTSEVTPDLLPSDGGVIKIPDMGTVYNMIPIQSSMVIFASNGVWAVSGSEGIGFTANDYSIRKISSVGAIAETSFADVEGFAIWWNNDGIYTISTDNIGNFQVQSISDESIKSFYNDIPTASKKYAKATYNSLTRCIQWLYRSSVETDISDRYTYDSVLNFNLISKGFYNWTIGAGVKVHGLMAIEGAGTAEVEQDVIDSALDTVVDSSIDNIIIDGEVQVAFSSVTKFIVSRPSLSTQVTFVEESSTEYVDWPGEAQEINYDSSFTTGYSVDGQAVKYVQSNYVFLYLNEEQDASLFVRGVFDWTTSPSTTRWPTQQQAYKANRTNYGVRVKKMKVRGKGRCIQLLFESEDGKPFSIIGWSLVESSNQVP